MAVETPSRIRYVYKNGKRRRQGRLLCLQGASNRLDSGGGIDIDMYVTVGAFLAWKHVQERNGTIISSLPEVLKDCDFDWTLENRDTQFSPAQGVRSLVYATTEPLQDDEGDWQFPFAIVGAIYSSVTLPINMLGQGFALPQISGTATSAALDYAPYFARTIPRNDADAMALMEYYKSIGVTHVACLYIKDVWGNGYAIDLQNAGKKLGIHVVTYSYDDGDKDSIRSALKQLQNTGIHHVYAIMFTWRPVIEEAIDLGVIGTANHSWIAAEMTEWTSGSLEYNRSNPKELAMANALRGTGSLMLYAGTYDNGNFEKAIREFVENRTLQEEFIQAYAPEDRHVFDNYTFEFVQDYFFQKAAYDGVYSLAIAACQTPGNFTGPELYQTLINLQFDGVTGPVKFDTFTGTRAKESVTVRLDNVFWSNDQSEEDEIIRLDSRLSATVSQGSVIHHAPWLYNDNTTNTPPSLPPVDIEYNLIPLGAQIFGLVLGGVVICMILGLIGWTWCNRHIFVVKAGQPSFLSQICIGTIVMALAILPMSMQGTEPSPALNMACMATPWLIFLGFVISFSALFSKTWRLNQLMKSGLAMRRTQVKAEDVIWPFIVLMTINVAMLTGWSLVSPLKYVRIPAPNVDSYGRTLESHGRCQSPDYNYLYFLVPIAFFDFIGVAKATYQSYVARNLPTTLSESSNLALAMASLLETLLLGGPIFFMVMDNPTASFLVGSSLLCIIIMTMLLPIFVPKWVHRNRTAVDGRPGSVVSVHNVASSSNFSSNRSMRLESKWGLMYVSRKPLDGRSSLIHGGSSWLNSNENSSRAFGNVTTSSSNAPRRGSRGSLEMRASGLESVAEHEPFRS